MLNRIFLAFLFLLITGCTSFLDANKKFLDNWQTSNWVKCPNGFLVHNQFLCNYEKVYSELDTN